MSDAVGTKKIRAARDWNQLACEASDLPVEQQAVYIADNTNDPRAAGDYKMFAHGYHAMIEKWLRDQWLQGGLWR